MKLNLSAKELLALYNHLHPHVMEYEQMKYDETATDRVQLKQVYNRIRACIVNSLEGSTSKDKSVELFDSWSAHEQKKIDKLNSDLVELKKEQVELIKSDPDFFVPDASDDLTAPEYPRRGRGSNRGGNRNNKR